MSTNVTETLAQLFRAHGIEPEVQDEWLHFPAQRLKCSARIPKESQKERGYSVQLDVILVLGPGKSIGQGVAGMGPTRDAAIVDAFNVFTTSSYHVLLAAFFDVIDPDRVTREEWTIGGRKKHVLLGSFMGRGRFPQTKKRVPALVAQFQQMVQARSFGIGVHWVRLFYANIAGDRVPEVIVDNDPDEALQNSLLGMDWPATDGYYSAMLFLIIRDGLDVSQALATICQSADSEDAKIQREFLRRGASVSQSERLIAFLPMAFGRVLVQGMGVSLGESVTVVNPGTRAAREINLQDEPYFVEATRIAREAMEHGTMPREVFMNLAMRSAEAKAVNSLLGTGSKPENIRMKQVIVQLSEDGGASAAVPLPSPARAPRARAAWNFLLDMTIVLFMAGFVAQGLPLGMLLVGQRPPLLDSAAVGMPLAGCVLMAVPLGIFAVRRNRSWAWGFFGIFLLSGVAVLLTLKRRCPHCNQRFARETSCSSCHPEPRQG